MEIEKNMSTDLLKSEFRKPRQMLSEQEYEGHLSIHDDKMAEDLGFPGAPIEGPTHFSQFVPLLHEVFGGMIGLQRCISAHYQNMVVEGEEVQTMVEKAPNSSGMVAIFAQKRDGTPVLTGTASLGPDYGETELDKRISKLRPSSQLVILSELRVGQKGAGNPEAVRMDIDQHMGYMYPFQTNKSWKKLRKTMSFTRVILHGEVRLSL